MDLSEMRPALKELVLACVHRGTVKLASGAVSDFYIDGRQVTLSPEGLYYTAGLMAGILSEIEFDAVGGPTMGADPIVGALLYHFRHVRDRAEARGNAPDMVLGRVALTGFIIRKETKAHGMQKMIEGPPLASGARVVLVEDVVTSGGSVLKAAKAVEEAGAKVVKILALVDREEGAPEAMAAAGYDFEAIFTRQQLQKRS